MQTRKQIQNGNFYGIFDYGNKTKRKLTRISKLSASNMNQKHLSFFLFFVVLKYDEQQEHKNLKQRNCFYGFSFYKIKKKQMQAI